MIAMMYLCTYMKAAANLPHERMWRSDLSVYQRGKTYHYYFCIAGRRYRGTTRAKTETKARLVESQLMAKIEQGLLPTHLRKMPLLREYAVGFIRQVGFMPKKKSRLYYENGWRLLSTTAVAGMRLDQIDQRACERLSFTGSGSNANCALKTLRRMLNIAWDEGYLTRQAKINLREENERSAIMTPLQEADLLRCANQPLRDIILLIRDAGFRPAEGAALPWRNVDFFRNAILLQRGKVKKADRWVLMSDRVKTALLERAKETGSGEWVFPANAKSGRTTKSGHLENVNKTFDRVKVRAKLPKDIVLYSCRHTLATVLAEETGNMKLVQGHVGHSRLNTTMRYIHPAMKEAVDAVNKTNMDRAVVVADAVRHNSRHNSHAVN
jgi:integrase